MDIATIAGLILGVFAICGLAMGWNVGPFWDIPSIGVVFGGIMTSLLISQPLGQLKTMLPAYKYCFTYKSIPPIELIKQICGFSEIARRDGILSLENMLESIKDPFLRQGIQLAVDGTDPELITDILETEMENIEDRHAAVRKAWDVLKNGGPSWGAMGTSIGLVIMLRGGVEDPAKLTAGMAVALITTFYGAVVASYVVGPFIEKLESRHKDEMSTKAIMLKGIMSLQSGDNPRIVEQKLKIFLPPSQRNFGRDAG